MGNRLFLRSCGRPGGGSSGSKSGPAGVGGWFWGKAPQRSARLHKGAGPRPLGRWSGLAWIGPLALLIAPAQAQDPVQHHLFTYRGSGARAGLGSALLTLPDLDGDSYREFALASPGSFSNQRGRVEVCSGRTGKVLLQIDGEPGADGLGDRFGAALALMPDLDGDGWPELAVGAPLDDDGGSQSGAISVHSLSDGALLARLAGPGLEARSGERLACPGDLNADGIADLVSASAHSAQVRAWSGAWIAAIAAGQNPVGAPLLWSHTGAADTQLGRGLVALGDLDLDGTPDLAVGAPFDGPPEARPGRLWLLSGRNGVVLGSLAGAAPGDRFGESLAGPGDLDGDGRAELAVGAPGALGRRGRVAVLRGQALAQLAQGGGGAALELWSRQGDSVGEGLGAALSGGGDLNGDGIGDLAAASLWFGLTGSQARVALWSGQGGLALGAYLGPSAAGRFGLGLDLAGDVNGDGSADLLIGVPYEGAAAEGRASLLSGQALRLAASAHLIAVDSGGQSLFSLDAGPANAGLVYFVLGSASGSAPGTPTGAGTVPLNLDWYTYYTLGGSSELITFNGVLDSTGRAQARVELPPGSSSVLTQLSLTYAWVGLDITAPGLPLSQFSNTVPLGFVENQCSATSLAQDCNRNGIKDSCDLAQGTSYDCNGNGLPDECDLASGTSLDLDQDHLPDECQHVVFVDRAATGANDGSSWTNAFVDLRAVLDTATPYTQVWVREGRYTTNSAPFAGSPAFVLGDRVGLYGGFAGGETSIYQRNIAAHPTVLDADLLGNDAPGFQGFEENNWSVLVVGTKVQRDAVLDGFTLRGGNSSGLAGCAKWAVYFAACEGGAVYTMGSPTIRRCRFVENFGGHHGGAVYTTAAPLFIDCLFEDNFALQGGALYGDIGAAPEFLRCRLIGNSALEGGGLYSRGASSDGVTLQGCLLSGNQATVLGGAVLALDVGITLGHCTVVGNSSVQVAGGVWASPLAKPRIHNSILWDNGDQSGQGFAANLTAGAALTLGHCTVAGWIPGLPGTNVDALHPLFVDGLGPDGLAWSGDENPALASGSPALDGGSTAEVPFDVYDLDRDGDVLERLPFDLLGKARFVDLPGAPNSGLTLPGYGFSDRGAVERQD